MQKAASFIKSQQRVLTIIALLVFLVLFFSITTEGFATSRNVFNLLRQVAVLGILSVGMTSVIITGGIDLSVGALVSLISVVIAKLMVESGLPTFAACAVGVLVAMAVGLINGMIIVTTNMVPMICTLAMLQVLQGVAYVVTEALPVYGVSESIKVLGQGYVGIMPIPVIIMICIFLIGAFFLRRTYIGRYFYAVGSNAEASRLSGLNVKQMRVMAYGICGLLAGLASVVMVGRIGSGQPTCGSGMEMDVITACVVGGVSLSGGRGNVGGVLIGVLIMGVLSNGFGVMGVNMYNQMIFKGVILILVVGTDGLQQIYGSKNSRVLTGH